LRLPKDIVAPEQIDAITRLWHDANAPLWRDGSVPAPRRPFSADVADHLAMLSRQRNALQQGIEAIGEHLDHEHRGIEATRTGPPVAPRISRLLLVAADGSERFYRQVESIVLRHQGRVLVAQLDVSGETLGARLYGRARMVRALLIADRSEVARILTLLIA
jgi:hypothetical protein